MVGVVIAISIFTFTLAFWLLLINGSKRGAK